ncbi:MAG TPA: UDP-N-acetylmuramoyl-L-alanyl-D-glutamate--2,6-diaminopimelate ligase [Acidimicrobiales bacterium]|nr:UDP-N-acetylmuramoyl-L-alanyl-D-glutamate--2,6-diaminopimelate ligase [Acidimicrobiales bacterium]
MQLASLLGGVDVLERRGDLDVDVRSVTHDSQQVVAGTLFCCVPGGAADGHDFAPAAVSAGAVALLCERVLPVDATQVRVASARASMGPIASALHGHPSRQLRVAGVTGTNGKTTTTYFLRSVLEAAGVSTAVIGTLGGARTTPEAPELQALLARSVEEGRGAVTMEVSSHALAQHRVDGTWFEVVAFTNLSQDHLDYHRDMESYFAAKASLFDPGRARLGVVNGDDPWGRRLLESVALPVRAYSMADADGLALRTTGSSFSWRGQSVELHLGGDFNVSNALCAAAMADALGVAAEAVAAGLSSLRAVPGRFEPVDAGQDFTVVVDYAHTPDGLTRVLQSARAASEGRVIAVFGCGGDRDRAKRPQMGEAASTLADVAVLTNDNPRSEDPMAIIGEVLAGVPLRRSVVVEPDREAAIALALEAAGPGDIVVIAGKGHETGQTTGDVTVDFDDRVVARRLLEARS